MAAFFSSRDRSVSIAAYWKQMPSISSQHFGLVLFDNGQQFERHAAGPLGSDLPLLYRGLADVDIASEKGLADMRPLGCA